MTFVAHAYAGAVTYYALSRVIGVETGVAAPAVGAFLGSAPDTLDWIGWKLGLFPRWWLYNILHHYRPIVIVECVLLVPGLHVLLDRLVHRKPEQVTLDDIPDMEKYIIAEILVWSFFTNILFLAWRLS